MNFYHCGYPNVQMMSRKLVYQQLLWQYNCILQIEGAFVQGLGFFMLEEYETNVDGLVLADGTWNYKIPTLDTIPKQFNVQILNTGHHKRRVLSSKGMTTKFSNLCLQQGVLCIYFCWFIIGLWVVWLDAIQYNLDITWNHMENGDSLKTKRTDILIRKW